jgi:Zn-dependent protease with chaperone function
MKPLIRELRLPSISAFALYLATVVAEVPVMLARMLLSLPVFALILLIKGDSPLGADGLVELALIPTGWALFALITPLGGGWWWSQNLGGREPSERERTAYQDAIDLLLGHAAGPVRQPSGWLVLDSPQADAAVCGDTLMLSRGLLESDFLPAVIAHELGHLNTSDGKLTASINRLVINPLPLRRQQKQPKEGTALLLAPDSMLLGITFIGAFIWLTRKLIAFAKGGFALRILAPFWGSYWREREYIADQYAASLGQAEELADFLEIHALIHDHPVPLIWLTEHTHPPTELRIDKLRKHAPATTQIAPGPEPVKAAPAGPPAAGPDGPAWTEPDPSAGRAIRSAGKSLPTFSHTDTGKDATR